MERLRTWLNAFKTWFDGLDQTRRTWFIVSAALGTAIVVGAINMATYVHMVPLFEQPLEAKASNNVIAHLKQADIKYEIERGTDKILVPDAARDALRLELTGGGMVDGKAVGLELFEENRFGSTKFVEHVRYVRGLQGEIERQINGFAAVSGSKVLLSLPEESLFEEDVVDPTASVYLELHNGRTLTKDEGERMAQLVANAVPRLHADHVEILDSDMRVIHGASDADGTNTVANSLAELKRNHERYYKKEIERILERVVGPGKVVARVNVELDNSQRAKQERKLHGEEAVQVSANVEESSMVGGKSAEGIPGTTANLPELEAANNQKNTGSSVTEQTTSREVGNYEVPETRTQTATLPGGIVSITAAVLVDGVWEEVAAGESAEGAKETAEEGETTTKYTPRTEAELASYTTLVAMSLGIAEKGVKVVNQPFAQVEVPTVKSSMLAMRPGDSWTPMLRYGFAFIALLCTFGFIVRPVMKNVTETEAEADAAAQLEAGIAGVLPDGTVIEQQDGESLADLIRRVSGGEELVTRDEVARLVSGDLTHSVVTLQAWIHQDEEA